LAESLEYKEIGHRLGRDSSVISRDVARHGGRARYQAAAAQEAACAGRERPKLFTVERSPRLRAVVCQQLQQGWSPASIAGRLPVLTTSARSSGRAPELALGHRPKATAAPTQTSLSKSTMTLFASRSITRKASLSAVRVLRNPPTVS
jgi:hypothetical protein